MPHVRINGRGYSEEIGQAYRMLPPWLADKLSVVDFVCGVNPNYAGVHGYVDRYDELAHCCYPWHLEGKSNVTVVLPLHYHPGTVIHELGHALHWMLGFPQSPRPVTAYAETNSHEAWAEAFRMAHTPGVAPWDISRSRLSRFKRDNPELAPFFERCTLYSDSELRL